MQKRTEPDTPGAGPDKLLTNDSQYGSERQIWVTGQTHTHVQQVAREHTIKSLQDMFAGSIEADVVADVLAECDWQADVTLDRLLAMGPGEDSGGQGGPRPPLPGLPPTAAQFPLHLPPPPLPTPPAGSNPFSMPPPPPHGRALMGQGVHAAGTVSMSSYLSQPPPGAVYSQLSPPLPASSASPMQTAPGSSRQSSLPKMAPLNVTARSRLPSVKQQDSGLVDLATSTPRTPNMSGIEFPMFKNSTKAEESMQSAMEAIDSYAQNAASQNFESSFHMATANSMFDWNMQAENHSPFNTDAPPLSTPSPGAPPSYHPMQGMGPYESQSDSLFCTNYNQGNEVKPVSPNSYVSAFGSGDLFSVPPPSTKPSNAGALGLYATPPQDLASTMPPTSVPYSSAFPSSNSTMLSSKPAAAEQEDEATALAALRSARVRRRVPRKAAISLNPEERESLEKLIEEVIIGGVGADIIDDCTSSEDDTSDGRDTDKSGKKDDQGKAHPSHLKVAAKHMKNLPPRFLRRLQAAQKQGEIRVEGGLENLELDYELPEELALELQAEPELDDRKAEPRKTRKKKGLLESLDPYFDDLVLSDSEVNENKSVEASKPSDMNLNVNVTVTPRLSQSKEQLVSPPSDRTNILDTGFGSGPPSRSSPRLMRRAPMSGGVPVSESLGIPMAINAHDLEQQLRHVSAQPPASRHTSQPHYGDPPAVNRVSAMPPRSQPQPTEPRMKFSVNAPEFVPKTFIPVNVTSAGSVLLDSRERGLGQHFVIGSPYHSPVGRLSPATITLGTRAQVRHTPSPTYLVPKSTAAVAANHAATLQAQTVLQAQAALQSQAARQTAALQSQAAAAAAAGLVYSPYAALPPGYAYTGLPPQYAFRPAYPAAMPPPSWSPEKGVLEPTAVRAGAAHRASPYGFKENAWIQALSPRHSPIPHLHPQARLSHLHNPHALPAHAYKQKFMPTVLTHAQDPMVGEGKPRASDVDIRVRLEEILCLGHKVMVILRGASGSGKSYLARELNKGRSGVILTTDDFFISGEKYDFDFAKLSDAHEWNRKRAKTALMEGQNPVIIDNTNSQSWEMKVYVSLAQQFKYHVEIALPNTPWQFKAKELHKRSVHGVTLETIERMLERFEHYVTVESIMGIAEAKPEDGDIAAGLEGGAPKKPHRRRKRRRKRKGRDTSEAGDEKPDEEKESSDEEGGGERDSHTHEGNETDKTSRKSSEGMAAESGCSSEVGRKPSDTAEPAAAILETQSSEAGASELGHAEVAVGHDVTTESGAELGASTEVAVEATEVADMSEVVKDGSEAVQAAASVPLEGKEAAAAQEAEDGPTSEHDDVPELPESSLVEEGRRQPRTSTSEEELEETDVQPVRLEPELKEGIQRALKQILEARHDDQHHDIIQVVLREHLQPYKLPAEIQKEIEDIIKEKMLDGLTNNEVAELTQSRPGQASQPQFIGKRPHAEDVNDMYMHHPHLHQGGAHSLPSHSELTYWQQVSQQPDPYQVRVPETAVPKEGHTSWNDAMPQRDRKIARRNNKSVSEDPDSPKSKSAFRASRQLSEPAPTLDNTLKADLMNQDWVLTRMQAGEVPQTSQPDCRMPSQDVATFTYPQDLAGVQKAASMGEAGLQGISYMGLSPCRPRDIQDPRRVSPPMSPCKTLKVDRGCSTDDLEPGQEGGGVDFLATCFPTVARDDLEDMMQSCQGDVQWAVNVLLDAGYEYNQPAPVARCAQRQSPDGLAAEIAAEHLDSILPLEVLAQVALQGSEAVDASLQQKLVVGSMSRLKFIEDFHHQHLQLKAGKVTPSTPSALGQLQDYTSEEEEGTGNGSAPAAEGLRLQLPRALTRQLMEMFGPVAFLDDPNNLSADEMCVELDHVTAQRLHDCWSRTLMGRLQPDTSGVLADEALARRLQEEEDRASDQASDPGCSPRKVSVQPRDMREQSQSPPASLREIMDEEQAIELSKTQYDLELKQRDVHREEQAMLLATKLKRQKLVEMFPHLDPTILEEIFKQNNYSLETSVAEIQVSLDENEVPQNVMSPEALAAYEASLIQQAKEASLEERGIASGFCEGPVDPVSRPGVQDLQYHDFRVEANKHHRLRHECFTKAQEAYRKGMKGVASFYAQQGHLHTVSLKEANMQAAQHVMETRSQASELGNQIDLHFLHVDEALQVLETVLVNKETELSVQPNKRHRNLYVVTGKGKHSHRGVAKIRPAVIDFLTRKKYKFSESKPGVLKVLLKYRTKRTPELDHS